jgi:hypothetical protein
MSKQNPKFPPRLAAAGYFAERLARDRHEAQYVFMDRTTPVVSDKDPGNREKFLVKPSGKIEHIQPAAAAV